MSLACASCVFGAVSELLTPFTNPVTTVPVVTTAITVTGLNGSLSTSYSTITLSGSVPLPSNGMTVFHTSEITTQTLGTTLTYGTTYVYYSGFFGAAQSPVASTTCANSLSPTPLTTPATVDPASFVFVYDGNSALPAALLDYLDGVPDFISQLDSDKLTGCSILSGPASVSATITQQSAPSTVTAAYSPVSTVPASSSTSLTTLTTTKFSTSTFLTTTVVTSSSTPAIYTSNIGSSTAPSKSTIIQTSVTTAAASTIISTSSAVVSHATTVVLTTVSLPYSLVLSSLSSSQQTTVPTAQQVTLPESSSLSHSSSTASSSSGSQSSHVPSSSTSASSTPGGALFSLLPSLTLPAVPANNPPAASTTATSPASKTSASTSATPPPYANTVSSLPGYPGIVTGYSSARGPSNATATYSGPIYTGGSVPGLSRVAKFGLLESLIGLALPLLL